MTNLSKIYPNNFLSIILDFNYSYNYNFNKITFKNIDNSFNFFLLLYNLSRKVIQTLTLIENLNYLNYLKGSKEYGFFT